MSEPVRRAVVYLERNVPRECSPLEAEIIASLLSAELRPRLAQLAGGELTFYFTRDSVKHGKVIPGGRLSVGVTLMERWRPGVLTAPRGDTSNGGEWRTTMDDAA